LSKESIHLDLNYEVKVSTLIYLGGNQLITCSSKWFQRIINQRTNQKIKAIFT